MKVARHVAFAGVLLLLVSFRVCAESSAAWADDEQGVGLVLRLADERLALMPAVAAWKWSRGAAIEDPTRERLVLERAAQEARSLGLEVQSVDVLFALQQRLARDAQLALHAQWSAQRLGAIRDAPDLSTVIRPRLDALTGEMLRALHFGLPAIERMRRDGRLAVLAAEVLRTPNWSDAHRAVFLDALVAVRRTPPFDALARARAAGALRIGTTGDYAPFTLATGERDSGAGTAATLRGSDIDAALALAASLGLEARFVRTTWGSLLDDLAADRFDLAIGGISITPARVAVATFSRPYASGGKTLITRCTDARRLRSLRAIDRRGVRVIVNPGGTNEQFVREHVHRATVQVFPDNRAIFEEIRAGRADAMITDDVEVELQIRQHAELCRPTRATFTHAHKAILMPRGAATLAAAVDAWLAQSLASGEAARRLDDELRRACGTPAARRPPAPACR